NAHFVARAGNGWRVRHWERGAGPTQACGTGTVAVAAVLIAAGDATSPLALHVPGGVLEVTWEPGVRATLVGDAVREFERVVA
ncbi:MAG: diaminopimelate epimerase, partial [Candidatus Eremiobacteraeota bacterium]|nr:diaminopimelate epimerase [Candidatus Eremiobacteraeota bacterium]